LQHSAREINRAVKAEAHNASPLLSCGVIFAKAKSAVLWKKLPVHRTPATADTTNEKSALTGENLYMKAAGIVRRIDD